jgi:hypothetical protein
MAASDTPERIPCAHCKSTGTCSAADGSACAFCSARGSLHWQDFSKTPKGLPCGICEGKGSVEPLSLKIHNRFLPVFAMCFVSALLVLIAGVLIWSPSSFEKVIGFAGTLIGSITAYYFGGKPVISSATAPKKDQPDDKPSDKR